MKERVFSLEVDVVDLVSATDKALSLAQEGGYVCVANVHMVMEALDDSDFATVVNSADLVVPDGKPLSVYQRINGAKEAKQVRGRDLFDSLIDVACINKLNVGFYGGSDDSVLSRLKDTLEKRTEGKLKVSYAYSPPFRKLNNSELTQVIDEIKYNKVDILFVGIGCPKQEKWMFENSKKLKCVMIGVGAVFDFVSGTKKEAPKFVYSIGLEWLFRLIAEPRRLWKRYLIHNTRFLYLIFVDLVRNRKKGSFH